VTLLKEVQAYVLDDLDKRIDDGRHLQLVLPLALTAYLIGDDFYEQTIKAAMALLANRVVPYTEPEQILIDAHSIVEDRSNVIGDWFIPSEVLKRKLREMPERKWGEYKHEGITTERMAFLLKKRTVSLLSITLIKPKERLPRGQIYCAMEKEGEFRQTGVDERKVLKTAR
jgi:hypothetical protein